MSRSTFSFDRQAPAFDRRAGLPASAVQDIAASVLALVARPRGTARTVLEAGAGTGEIGRELVPRLATRGLGYLGFDLSLPMLRLFRRRCSEAAVLQADADSSWPLANGAARALFASRTAHLLRADHLAEEALRVLGAGGVVLLGGVRRQPDSCRAQMRRQMQALLEERGIEGRRRGRAWAHLEQIFSRRGCTVDRRSVTEWSVSERPADALEAWRHKDGLAGRSIPRGVHRDVVDRLERWAVARFGDLERSRATRERYELLVIQLPNGSSADSLEP